MTMAPLKKMIGANTGRMLGAKAFLDIPLDDHEVRLMGNWVEYKCNGTFALCSSRTTTRVDDQIRSRRLMALGLRLNELEKKEENT